MTLLDLYQQKESVFEEMLSMKTIDCIYYIMAMISLSKNERKKYFVKDIKNGELVFKNQKFLTKVEMSREDLIKQVTILKMKENYKHENEAFNLINFSMWAC